MSDADPFRGAPGPLPDPARDAELTGVLDRLARARDDAGRRVDGLLLGVPLPEPTVFDADRALLSTTEAVTSGSAHSTMFRPGPVDPAAAPSGAALRSPAARLLHAVARPVAALVLTSAAVLGGWLLVLEPSLGSRPVLVRDESMSPSLRTGDVALAVEPDGPLGVGAIVAVRVEDRRVVTRLIGREEQPPGASAAARVAAALVVRADAEPLEVTTVVPLDDLIGEVGAAVPRVGLPLVLLAAPGSSPTGALVAGALLVLTAVGTRDLARERRGPRQ